MALNAYLNKRVSVLTIDGRVMVGILHSCDGSMNLVLQGATERIIRPADEDVPSEEVPLGLYIIRGDTVAVVGRIDEEVDSKIDWSKVHGDVLGSTKHTRGKEMRGDGKDNSTSAVRMAGARGKKSWNLVYIWIYDGMIPTKDSDK
ncbi:hypothetical protein yc1106_03424 [Curvularia clavata]|uniref:LSM2-LSM8 complex subunit LSM8 n=1 Tax=Curvularia clavata TaxID=95742 RepID=A0A9Q9DRK7_CURCL|nr:hypothetical protein yc1106_03424 [Curvularia clavata]